MRGPAWNFPNVDEAVDECGDVAAAHVWVARAQSALAVAAHRVDVPAVALHEHCVFLAATHIRHHYVEAAYFRQVMDNFVAANSQLSIIVI